MRVGLWVKRFLGLFLAMAISYGLVQLMPATADPVALQALEGTAPTEVDGQAIEGTTVFESRDSIEIYPSSTEPAAGFIFFPGGLVDPRAYTHILTPIAQAGYLVVILKAPMDLPIIDIGGASTVVDANPSVTTWAVGGHSLGGVAASTYAAGNPQEVPAVVLWASYPNTDLSTVGGLEALSVAGANDMITTPEDIEGAAAKLPVDTRYVELEGVIHSYFGDYGEQEGDGTPGISRAWGQSRIVGVTKNWLDAYSGIKPE